MNLQNYSCVVVAALLLVMAAGCPATPPELTTIDGLAGGALTSGISAPDANITSLTFDEANGQSLMADAVAAGVVTASAAVVTPVIARPAPLLVNWMGFPIGSTAFPLAADGYAAYSQACTDAFPAAAHEPVAHLCTENEMLMAVMTNPAAIPADAFGAGYSTFSFGARFNRGEEDGMEVINDCQAWSAAPYAWQNSPDGEGAARRMAVILNGDDGPYPWYAECGAGRVACCR